jgi:hypothetical protein
MNLDVAPADCAVGTREPEHIVSQVDRMRLLDEALAFAMPEPRGWPRGQQPANTGTAGYWIDERASRLVTDLVMERVVLAYAKGILKGGRRFLRPGPAKSDRRHLKWSSSWLGTHDWER